MKHLFLSMAAVAMLASCSSEEVLDKAQTPKSAIGFSTFVDKSTRAAQDINLTNIGTFYVYGWRGDAQILNAEPVTVKNENGETDYTNKRYWEKGFIYNFEAIYPEAGTNTGITFDADKDGGTITFVNNKETDLLYSKAKETDTTNGVPSGENVKVPFTFNHLLSRVKFSFTHTFSPAVTLRVKDLTISGTYESGSIKLSEATPAWDVKNSSELNVEFDPIILGPTSTESEHFYLIPADKVDGYTVTFTVRLTQGSANTDYYFRSTISADDMEIGHSYDYSAEITPENITPGGLSEIVFTASINNWDPVTPTETPIDQQATGTPAVPTP